MDIRLVPCPPWQAFIEGSIYPDAEVPWCDDPAFTLLREFPGLQASVSGRIAAALAQTMALVRALTQVDICTSSTRSGRHAGCAWVSA